VRRWRSPEGDLDERRGSVLVRHGKGDKRREVGMDDWGWQQLHAWIQRRLELPSPTRHTQVGLARGDEPRTTQA